MDEDKQNPSDVKGKNVSETGEAEQSGADSEAKCKKNEKDEGKEMGSSSTASGSESVVNKERNKKDDEDLDGKDSDEEEEKKKKNDLETSTHDSPKQEKPRGDDDARTSSSADANKNGGSKGKQGESPVPEPDLSSSSSNPDANKNKGDQGKGGQNPSIQQDDLNNKKEKSNNPRCSTGNPDANKNKGDQGKGTQNPSFEQDDLNNKKEKSSNPRSIIITELEQHIKGAEGNSGARDHCTIDIAGLISAMSGVAEVLKVDESLEIKVTAQQERMDKMSTELSDLKATVDQLKNDETEVTEPPAVPQTVPVQAITERDVRQRQAKIEDEEKELQEALYNTLEKSVVIMASVFIACHTLIASSQQASNNILRLVLVVMLIILIWIATIVVLVIWWSKLDSIYDKIKSLDKRQGDLFKAAEPLKLEDIPQHIKPSTSKWWYRFLIIFLGLFATGFSVYAGCISFSLLSFQGPSSPAIQQLLPLTQGFADQ